jgi:hypothetical protein
MGCKFPIWNKELDDKLLDEISKGTSYIELTIVMKTSYTSIKKRLKEMGFEGLKDARAVMTS